jgi:hypothetical protein
MEKKLQEIAKKELEGLLEKKISRKEAIKKTGYIAVSAATMMILLNSPKAQACSDAPAPPPDKPKNTGGGGPWKKR